MLKFMLMSGVFSVMLVSAVNAQNVTVSDDVFGKNDEKNRFNLPLVVFIKLIMRLRKKLN